MHNRMSTYQYGTTTVRSIGSIFQGPIGILTTGSGYQTHISGGQFGGGVSGSAYKCSFVTNANFDALSATCTP